MGVRVSFGLMYCGWGLREGVGSNGGDGVEPRRWVVGCAVLRLGLCVLAGLGGDVSNRDVVVGAGFSNQGSPLSPSRLEATR